MLRDAMLFPQEWFIHVRNGKGGRERLSPIIGKNAAQIVERIADTPAEEKVWQHIHTSADIHAYHAEYATAIGITGRYLDDYEKMRAEKHLNPNDPFFQGNIALATLQRLKRNFRSGYWEVSLLHTKPLGDIPEELLPERKKTTRET